MKKKGITRVSFWTRNSFRWNNIKMQKLHDKVLKIEDELEEIRKILFETYTNFKEKVQERK